MNSWFENPQKKKMGLVLGGGGARGCYEIGAWQMFSEENIVFDCVAGTSIGAIVGAIYVQQSLSEIVQFVYDMHPQAIARDLFAFPDSFTKLLQSHKEISSFMEQYILSAKGMDISPLKSEIEKMFSYEKFMKSPINYACMTYNVTKRKPEAYFKDQMTRENAVNIILASASCYPAFPMLEMNGDQYIDGGYADNVPVDLAQKMGAEKILAFNVEGPGITRPVLPGTDVLNIKPMLPLGNFLDFSSESCVRSMNIGYLETGKLTGRFAGYLYTFTQESLQDLYFMDQYLSFMFMMIHQPISQKQAMKIVRDTVGFHPSYLSKMKAEDYSYGELTEALAYISGVDPARLYSAYHYVASLLKCLEAIKLDHIPDDASKIVSYLYSMGQEKLMPILHALIIHENGQRTDLISTLEHLFYDQMILAWVWYFLGEAFYHVKQSADGNKTESAKTAGSRNSASDA